MFIQVTHAALVVLLVVALPLWDRAETRRLKSNPTGRVRIRSYQKTIAWLWLTTLVLLFTVPWAQLVHPGLSAAALASTRLRGSFRTLSFGLLGGLALGLALPVLLGRYNPAARERLVAQFSTIGFFLPAGLVERRWFAAVCVSAGCCEEVIYRGFMFPWFAEGPLGLGAVGGAIAAAVAFGIAHGYQGVVGIVSTGVMAALLTALFLATGALWLPIAVHILMDLRILLVWPVNGLGSAPQE